MAELKESIMACLSPELAAIAARELNETPATRRQSLIELKRRLGKDDGTLEDDTILLRFLRCKKFDVQRAMSVYNGYHSYRRDNPDLFKDLSISSVNHIWESGALGGLKDRDKKGRAVMVAFPGRWNPEEHSLEDMLRAMIIQLEFYIQNIETQINGIVLIADFTDFSLYQARCIRPWYIQMMSALVQNAFPARFKGVYIINQPWYFSLIMAVVSRLLSEKMNSRIHMLGNNYEQLSDYFNLEQLPAELGGSRPPYDCSEWIDNLTKLSVAMETKTTPHTIPSKSHIQTEV